MNGELFVANARSPNLTSANRERAKTTLNGKRLLFWTKKSPKMKTKRKSSTFLLITLNAPDVKSSSILTFALPIPVVAILNEAAPEDVAVADVALTERCAAVVGTIVVTENNVVEETSVAESSVNNGKVAVEDSEAVIVVVMAKALLVAVETSVEDVADPVQKAAADLAVNVCQLLLK